MICTYILITEVFHQVYWYEFLRKKNYDNHQYFNLKVLMLEVKVVDLELHFIYANVNKEGLLINVC